MDFFDDVVEVALLDNKKDTKRYHLTSVYIAIGTECKNKKEFNVNEKEYTSFLIYRLKNTKEISFYIKTKKFKEVFKTDIHKIEEEFVFPYPLVFTIHIHDMEKVDEEGYLHIYYVCNLNVDKIITNSDRNNFMLSMQKKNGDNEFIFSKSQEGFHSFQVYHN